MVEKVKPLKFNFEPLYWNQGSIYQNTPAGADTYSTMSAEGNGGYSGTINGSDWEGVGTSKLNSVYSMGFVNRQRIDLIGLTIQEIALAPLGNATQRMEPFALGYITDSAGRLNTYDDGGAGGVRQVGRAFIREYVFFTTQPITNAALQDTILGTSSPIPPYLGEGNLDGAQLVAGYSSTYTRDFGTPDIDGWCVKMQESKLGFGDIINSPTLHCTKVIAVEGRLEDLPTYNGSNSPVTSPLFVDIPSSCEVITVAEVEPDDVEYFATMTRSLQPPSKLE